jgi:hypothetical protein
MVPETNCGLSFADVKTANMTKEIFDELYELSDKTCRKISTMIKYLNKNPTKGQKFKDRSNPKSDDSPTKGD